MTKRAVGTHLGKCWVEQADIIFFMGMDVAGNALP